MTTDPRVLRKEETTLEMDTPVLDESSEASPSKATQPGTTESSSEEAPTQRALLRCVDLKKTNVTLPFYLADKWNVFVSTMLDKDAHFPADVSRYYDAYCAVVHADRQGEVIDVDTVYELEPFFRLCAKDEHTPLHILNKLCTVTSRRQFESYIQHERDVVRAPLFIAFLRLFIQNLASCEANTPPAAEGSTKSWYYCKAVYDTLMKDMSTNESNAPQSLFQKRLQRRVDKCLTIITSVVE